MRCFMTFLALIGITIATHAQNGVWANLDRQSSSRHLSAANLSPKQKELIRQLLKNRAHLHDTWSCDSDDPAGEWLDGLKYEEILLAPKQHVVLVEAGMGCARGGQGANGAMWIFRLHGSHPVLLATPEWDFNGWLYGIPQTMSHGYRDIVLGWHMGARETDFKYFRFDGKSYQSISAATEEDDDEGHSKFTVTSP